MSNHVDPDNSAGILLLQPTHCSILFIIEEIPATDKKLIKGAEQRTSAYDF